MINNHIHELLEPEGRGGEKGGGDMGRGGRGYIESPVSVHPGGRRRRGQPSGYIPSLIGFK